MKRITSAIPALILPFSGNSLPFSFSKLPDKDVCKYGSFEPNVICYSTIIDGFSKEKRMDKALIIFQDMLDKRMESNVVTFSSLVNGFCIVGHWDEAKRLLAAMVNKGISPDAYVFNALIAPLCSKEGKLSKAIEILELMIRTGVKPFVITYNSLIHGLCNSNKWTEATSLLGRMMNEGVHHDVATFIS
ncbi:pentatricopeptide repeat-containing protein At5g16640, mitochondrial-like isoform X2 [Hibiscus syriacus]|uniref:pentatricopeptide repeat-containing protein At5g16640, mitochondrial-like isoform X2 n=1 Tax=Hibiscus syriacus TaxID=106335 RepID=UPI001923DCD1|nr:pentatricopeptide repeat-containing protein At5g16640, mitochondrial-like isoform X2 [Hibiscus syriacus]